MDTTKLESVIQQHEGYRRFAYNDSLGYITIGVGRCIDKRVGKGLSPREALYLLRNDIEECEQKLSVYDFYKLLDEVRKGVMIELCFNLGLKGLLSFKKMLANVENGKWVDAVNELHDSKWAKQVSVDRVFNICHRLEHGKYPE